MYGVDFEETFAPVGGLNTFRIIVAYATFMKWDNHAYDISNAFMNSPINVEIWITLPRVGFEYGKLQRALNGLKQGSMVWNKDLHANLL